MKRTGSPYPSPARSSYISAPFVSIGGTGVDCGDVGNVATDEFARNKRADAAGAWSDGETETVGAATGAHVIVGELISSSIVRSP